LVIKATGAASVIAEAVAGIFNGEGFIDSARAAWDRVLVEAQGAFDDNPVDFRFEYDSSILQEVTVTAQKVSTGVREVAEANQAVTDTLVEIDTKSEEITNKALERGEKLIDQIERKSLVSERELEIMQATFGLTDDERKLKEKLLGIEHDLLDTTRNIHELNLSKEETNRLIQEAQAETQTLIDIEQQKHDAAMDHKSKEMAADEERNKKRQELEKQTSNLIEDINTKTYASMENAFVDFVSTGKLSFKDLVDEMLDQLKRLVAKKIFQTILGIFGGGGGIGGFFAGLFDQGGVIPAGKFGIVGEKGPEIVTGPAKVIGRSETERMLGDASSGGGSGTNITYNISAVDAQSFKELVASDPEFLYNVTQAGARMQPI
jgi:lambda family phage tail tape measure protein